MLENSVPARILLGVEYMNIPRILNGLDYKLYDIELPKGWWTNLYKRSEMELYDFQSTFNCGWGMILATNYPFNISVKDCEVIGEVL